MNPEEEATYAARIVEAAVGCNMVNAALRALLDYQSPDKRLRPQLTELRKISERVLPRLTASADSAGADALNGAANAAAEVGRLLLYLDGAGMAAVVRYAGQLARLACECAAADAQLPTPLPPANPTLRPAA